MPTPDELYPAPSQDVGGLPLSSTLPGKPSLPTPSGQQGTDKMLEAFASALASFGDAFRQFGGKPAVFQKERREATEATRKAKHEELLVQSEGRKAEAEEQRTAIAASKEQREALAGERDYRLRVLEFTRKNSADEIKAAESYLTYAGKLHEQGLDPSVIENALSGMADRTGLDFLKDLAPSLAKDKSLALTAGPAMSILKEDSSGIGGMFLANARSQMTKDPGKFRTDLAHTTAIVAFNTIAEKLPSAVAYLKGQKGDQPITTEDVAGLFQQQNTVYGQLVRGAWDAPAEVRTQLDKILAANGVQTPAIGAKVAEQAALAPGEVKKAVDIERGKKGVEQEFLPYEVEKTKQLTRIRAKVEADVAAGKPASFDDIRGLRQEFRQLSADFKESRDSFNALSALAAVEPSAMGDISLIFSYMKILDPRSTVREGEAATVEKARGVPDTVLNLYNKIVQGKKLTDEQRADIKDRAKIAFDTRLKSQVELEDEYRRLAGIREINPNEVIVDLIGDLRRPKVLKIERND